MTLTAVVMALCAHLPFAPVGVWIDEKAVATSFTRTKDGWRATAQSERFEIRVAPAQNGYRISIHPPREVSVSFRFPGASLPVRTTAEDSARVLLLSVGFPVCRTCDGLCNADTKTVYKFRGLDFMLYGGYDSGGVRADFTPGATLVISASPYDESNATRVFSDDAPYNPLLRALQRMSDPQDGIVQNFGTNPGTMTALALRATGGTNLARSWASIAAFTHVRVTPAGGADLDVFSRALNTAGVAGGWRLDTFHRETLPNVVATHVESPNGRFVVATAFNFDDDVLSRQISFADLGLDSSGLYCVFDFWSNRFLGVAAGTIFITVPANGCRTLVIRRFIGRPQIVGADWHIAAERVSNVVSAWDEKKRTLKGSVIANPNRPISLFVSPFGIGKRFIPTFVTTDRGSVTIHEGVGVWRLEINHAKAEKVGFSITFDDGQPLGENAKVEVSAVAPTGWAASFSIKRKDQEIGGFYLVRNGTLLGYCFDSVIVDADVEPLADYTYEIVPVDYCGMPRAASNITLRPAWPTDISLSKLPLWSYRPEILPPLNNRALGGGALLLNEQQVPGLWVASPGEVRYRLYRTFSLFDGFAGVTDNVVGSATFVIKGDGVELWRSDVLGAGESQAFKVDVSNVYLLELHTEGSTYGAAWFNPVLKAKPRP